MVHSSLLIGAFAIFVAYPAATEAQSTSARSASVNQEDEEQPLPPAQPTRLESGKTVGQRRTREDVVAGPGIEPMARIENRIQNRVQNRIRNRIDRNYNPQAISTEPFAVARDTSGSNRRAR